MRNVLSVLFGVLATILFFMVSSGISESFFDFLYWGDLENLFYFVMRVVGTLLFAVAFLVCVFNGHKNDATDVWSQEKKESGWLAYGAFVGATFILILAVFMFDSSHDLLGSFFAVLFIMFAIVGYMVGSMAFSELAKYEEAVDQDGLNEAIREHTQDYLKIKQSQVTYRGFDGNSLEVNVKIGRTQSKIVLDFDPDETWYTATGRTVKLFTFEQWAIVLFDNPRRIKVFQSKIHSS